ncbi:MAG TPA: hypothetical protein PKI77_18805 [Mycobacterium sp.]|nr:hypothetical protein [Mycobacterium sp.]
MAVSPTTVTSLRAGDVATVVPIVTTMAKAYTRGRGFTDNDPNEEIAAVIATASARLAANGEQLAGKRVDDVEVRYSLASTFGWTLAELAVLNRYRVTAM